MMRERMIHHVDGACGSHRIGNFESSSSLFLERARKELRKDEWKDTQFKRVCVGRVFCSSRRTKKLFQEEQRAIYRKTDKMTKERAKRQLSVVVIVFRCCLLVFSPNCILHVFGEIG